MQNYIRQKDYNPELLKDYFLKLSEEVGELSRAMRKGLKATNEKEIIGTIDEEILLRHCDCKSIRHWFGKGH